MNKKKKNPRDCGVLNLLSERLFGNENTKAKNGSAPLARARRYNGHDLPRVEGVGEPHCPPISHRHLARKTLEESRWSPRAQHCLHVFSTILHRTPGCGFCAWPLLCNIQFGNIGCICFIDANRAASKTIMMKKKKETPTTSKHTHSHC